MSQRSPRLPKKYDALMVNILYIFRHVSAFSVRDLLLILTKDFVSFFRFRDEKLTRSNVRNIQDSNVNVDKVELK